ncbi:glycerol-3-phosphate responsive antiterminator [Paenibacillus doosanensis]|uniref:Glycerol uptake operon antiterminator regulatory protein n=1 Tax=Paenibacillus konkukensis TaxID=2020716 RepID=A0ABY4RJX5_9BACL|nr:MULTISPECIES: glycerol-3-phosphate responsive antiterminator [Paenibacillus]MCS7464819.1 glycerol-3-phosphate responsive antiterminator [Paenibacillus doosanensis]UQZ82135.1 Glycerol-3-phosphate responsive antiterminator [Paenibacillus konkukensis]
MYPIVDLVEHQTIAAVQREEDLELALKSEANIIFLLTGSIFNMKELVDRIKEAGKHVFPHMEFIDGIAPDKSGVAYMAQNIKPTGIISTKSNLIRVAKDHKLMAIQRIFLIDRSAVTRGIKAVEQSQPDAIEVMPGIMPRIVREMTNMTPLPIIAGGLVGNQEEIDEALRAGALAVSAGKSDLW